MADNPCHARHRVGISDSQRATHCVEPDYFSDVAFQCADVRLRRIEDNAMTVASEIARPADRWQQLEKSLRRQHVGSLA